MPVTDSKGRRGQRGCAVEFGGGDGVQRAVDQGRFAGAGNAGDAGQQAQGDLQVDRLQVVTRGTREH